jgi:hypothetical protein
MFKNAFGSASCRETSQLLAPFGVLVACGALFGIEMRRPNVVRAEAVPARDLDGDGLPDQQEWVLGTNPLLPDTDDDGYTDTEEFARGSSPIYPTSTPFTTGLHVGMSARGEIDGLHGFIAVYLPDSDFRRVDLRIGMLSGRRIVYLPQSFIVENATVEFTGAHQDSASIALIDFHFPRAWVDHTGHLTMFAAVGRVGSGRLDSVSVIDLFNIGGVIALAMPDPANIPAVQFGGGGGGASSSGSTVYKPLTTSGNDTPRGWTIEEVCFQQSEPVRMSGSIVTNEVISAECQSGWDGSCPGACAESVGTIYTSIDPAALIGG